MLIRKQTRQCPTPCTLKPHALSEQHMVHGYVVEQCQVNSVMYACKHFRAEALFFGDHTYEASMLEMCMFTKLAIETCAWLILAM